MSEMDTQLAFFLTGAAMMLILLGFVVAVIMPRADQWSKRFFVVFFAVLTLYGSLGVADTVLTTIPDTKAGLEIVSYFETLVASVMMPILTVYLLHCCGEDWRHSKLFRTVAILWMLALIIINMVSPFTDWVYYSTQENQFVRGPLYPLLMILLIAVPVLNIIYMIRWRSRLPGKTFYAFLVGTIPMTIMMAIHLFIDMFMYIGIGFAIFGLSMIIIILTNQADQYMRQQREINHQRASIMVLQMRPHFIYNTMMSIYYLCKQDPDLAQKVTLDFTTYLRKNFTAIASEELIPFSGELEHTRAYLAVEQAQFEDGLFTDYDTLHTDFRLPAPTLQPIVENAVKHGMDPDSEPLHIFIRTRKTEAGSEIIVENTGADFEPAEDDEPHIALKNIRQRLEMMCRGRMEITPRDGGGTVVQVTIPDNARTAG